MSTRDRDYQLMMSELAEATRRRDTELNIAEQAYQDSTEKISAELARAETEATTTTRQARVAASQVLAVDDEAARLWQHLRQAGGLRLRPLGKLGEPATVATLPQSAKPQQAAIVDANSAEEQPTPRLLLARAAQRIDDTVRRPGRRALPRWTWPLLPLLGALVAALAGLTAAGLVTFGATPIWGGSVIRGLGWLTFIAAPSAGVPIATLIAHRRLQAKLDLGGVGLTLFGGMISATLLSLAFAATY